LIYNELPFLGGKAVRAPEIFFTKAGMSFGTVAYIGNVHIPGVKPDLCIDFYEGPIKEDVRKYVPPTKYDNVMSTSTIEPVGMGEQFDPKGSKEAIKKIVN
jgi:hypothetical protein